MNGGSVCSPRPLCPRISKPTAIFFIQFQICKTEHDNAQQRKYLTEYLATWKDALFVIQCITSLFSIPTARDSHPKSCSSLQKPNLTMHCKENDRNKWHKWLVEKIRISTLGGKFVFRHISRPNCELLLKFPNSFLIAPSFAKKTRFYLGYQNTKKNSNQTLHLKVDW